MECGYHGLTFDCTGACVRAPTQEGRIPKNAKVHSYPVVDRYDLLWIWMGDADEADAVPLTLSEVYWLALEDSGGELSGWAENAGEESAP